MERDENKISHAKFFSRFLAFLIDSTILLIAPTIMAYTYLGHSFLTLKNLYEELPTWATPIVFALYYLSINYFIIYKKETTIGKSVFNLKIRSIDGKRLSPLQIIQREFIGKLISSSLLYIGYIIAPFTKEKQAFHDILSKTVVVQDKNSSSISVIAASPSYRVITLQVLILIVLLKVKNDFNQKIFENKKNEISNFNNVYHLDQEKALSEIKLNREKEEISRRIKEKKYKISSIPKHLLTDPEIQILTLKYQAYSLKDWPDDVQIFHDSLKESFKTIYKFEDYLPQKYLEMNDVKAMIHENKEHNKLNFMTFLLDTKNSGNIRLSNFPPAHPDFFNDSEFSHFAINECIINDTQFLKEAEYTQEAIENIKKATFSPRGIDIDCLPNVTKNDKEFLIEVLRRTHYPEKILKILNDPIFYEERNLKTIEGMEGRINFDLTRVAEFEIEVQNHPDFQQKLFNNYPNAIKYLSNEVIIKTEILEDFLSDEYRPERFFNEFQKSQTNITKFLTKYKNDSPEALLNYKEKILKLLASNDLLLQQRIKSIRSIIPSMPAEIINDEEFHIKIIRSLGDYAHIYLESLVHYRSIRGKISEEIISGCLDDGRYFALIHYSDILREDPKRHEEIKEICFKKNVETSRKTSSSRAGSR